jgi:hypothetical protein
MGGDHTRDASKETKTGQKPGPAPSFQAVSRQADACREDGVRLHKEAGGQAWPPAAMKCADPFGPPVNGRSVLHSAGIAPNG